jgi:hypothetical protein
VRIGHNLLEDNFRSGLDLEQSWQVTEVPGRLSADDGIASGSDRGLHVRSGGTNPETRQPAFSKTAHGEDDHVKWMVDTRRLSSHGMPGFDALIDQELSISMRVRGQIFGTAAHPFARAVIDPETDLRLAAFAMNVIDYETGMVFDVWMTNGAIFPYYERLNLGGSTTFQAFSSVFPPVPRRPEEWHQVTVAYDQGGGTVRWLIDDAEVARLKTIGLPAPDATLLIDHGGTPESASPRQLNCGMAMFTLLDAGWTPSGEGLVSLAPPYAFPTDFVGGPNLFGQGAELEVDLFEVRTDRISNA